jgi:hypothetical protein
LKPETCTCEYICELNAEIARLNSNEYFKAWCNDEMDIFDNLTTVIIGFDSFTVQPGFINRLKALPDNYLANKVLESLEWQLIYFLLGKSNYVASPNANSSKSLAQSFGLGK